MELFVETIEVAYLVMVLFVSLFFLLSVFVKDNSVMDIAWGLGFIMISLFTGIYFIIERDNIFLSQIVITILVSIWGTRLATHIAIRNWGNGEDKRYAVWRKEWKKAGDLYFYLRSFLQVFFLQGILMLYVATPILLINTYADSDTIHPIQIAGALIWLFGFSYEAAADYQLWCFKRKNKGKVMNKGLWKFSRHPNYFGEIVLWFGIALIAVPYEYGYLAFYGPLFIAFLILFVSGISLQEKHKKGNKSYAKYKKETSAIVPMM